MTENLRDLCAKRDAAGEPVPLIARLFGFKTWTEWGTEMTRPNPILMNVPWKEYTPPEDTK